MKKHKSKKRKHQADKRTWIERKMAEFLGHKGIKFIEQYAIPKCKCIPDFYLPEQNIMLFTDGTFWHSKPRRQFCDNRINKRLMKAGYRVIRVWEHDMKDNFGKVATDLLNKIYERKENPENAGIQ